MYLFIHILYTLKVTYVTVQNKRCMIIERVHLLGFNIDHDTNKQDLFTMYIFMCHFLWTSAVDPLLPDVGQLLSFTARVKRLCE